MARRQKPAGVNSSDQTSGSRDRCQDQGLGRLAGEMLTRMRRLIRQAVPEKVVEEE
ncbi:MAG: hypothetical protein R3C02_23125 [Planctomycetaceae bacterium]